MRQKEPDPAWARRARNDDGDQAGRQISSTSSKPKPQAQVYALRFARRGFRVLPLHGIRSGRCTCGDPQCGTKSGKHPFERFAPHGKDDATTDLKTIKQWFARFPKLNYGIVTDNLRTVDIDPRNGGDRAWRKLIGRTIAMPHTWCVATGGGGQHLIFAASVGVPSGKLAHGVDLKGVGGYIVGVGSRHISGKRYRWSPDRSPEDVELAPLPDWIAETAAKPTTWTPRDAAYYERLIAPAMNGERHARVASLLGHLFGAVHPNRGILLQLVLSHVKQTYPDLTDFDDEEITKIAQWIARRDDSKGTIR
jgi:hypothetical protein